MKVLFLDCDGVVNYRDAIMAQRQSGNTNPYIVDPVCIARLRRILDTTGAFIVVTSSWRFDESAVAFLSRSLREHGRRIKGMTSKNEKTHRADEIREWLKGDEDVEKFAILDDDADAGFGMPSETFFRTSMDSGLTEECTERVISYLGKQ